MAEGLPKSLLDDRLPDWYRGVRIDLDGEVLAARKGAIESLSKTIELPMTRSVVAYAHGRKPRGEELIEWIRTAGRAQDETFSGDAGDLEPQVMVACAVANRLATQPRDSVTSVLSLLIQCAHFRGYSSKARGQDLNALAERQLRVADDSARQVPKAAATTLRVTANDHFADIGDPFPDDPNALTGAGIGPWARAVQGTLDAVIQRLDTVDKGLARHAQVSREELEITAWLLEEYCETASKPWAEVGNEAAGIFAAYELAKITQAPGFPSLGVMLASTLLKAGRDANSEVDILRAVQRSAKALKGAPTLVDELTPIASAIAAWRQMGGKSGWRELAKTNRGGGNLRKPSERELAEQSYREFILARQLKDD
jgi:hypothetical protein